MISMKSNCDSLQRFRLKRRKC